MSRVRWISPSPLWDDLVGSPAAFRAPALLRFAGDDFMQQFQGALEGDPRRVRGFVARPETWREPAVGLGASPGTARPLRLYQPVHGHFYLVAATLACRVPGLPEHTVDAAKGEVVAFVLRRITLGANQVETGEQAWVADEEGNGGWVAATGAALVPGEEQHPMFGTTFAGAGRMRRRVFAGLVPVSRREAFAGARDRGVAPLPSEEPRLVDFQRAVIDPWAEMRDWWSNPPEPRDDDTKRNAAIASLESGSALILLDFAEFLERWLPRVWTAVQNGAPGDLGGAQLTLYNTLEGRRMWTRSKQFAHSWTMRNAIREARAKRDAFESLPLDPGSSPKTVPDDFNPVLLLDPGTPPPSEGHDPNADFMALLTLLDPDSGGQGVLARPLARQVTAALAEVPAPATPPQLPALPKRDADVSDWFTIRCVYLKPNCGRRTPPVVSEPTERFKLASFFEPDAPARQLRVALPVDTSPATLRRYDRNVAFMLSSQLRKQMSRASSLKGLSEGKLGPVKGGLDLSVICSFSIPIITICALILLMIIVTLLNIIFWWLPLFRICFPIPRSS